MLLFITLALFINLILENEWVLNDLFIDMRSESCDVWLILLEELFFGLHDILHAFLLKWVLLFIQLFIMISSKLLLLFRFLIVHLFLQLVFSLLLLAGTLLSKGLLEVLSHSVSLVIQEFLMLLDLIFVSSLPSLLHIFCLLQADLDKFWFQPVFITVAFQNIRWLVRPDLSLMLDTEFSGLCLQSEIFISLCHIFFLFGLSVALITNLILFFTGS